MPGLMATLRRLVDTLIAGPLAETDEPELRRMLRGVPGCAVCHDKPLYCDACQTLRRDAALELERRGRRHASDAMAAQ